MELLERMREISGGLYISDLCSNFYMTNNQVDELKQIDSDDYSIHEWNDAAQYISGSNISFQDTNDAKSFICTLFSLNKKFY